MGVNVSPTFWANWTPMLLYPNFDLTKASLKSNKTVPFSQKEISFRPRSLQG